MMDSNTGGESCSPSCQASLQLQRWEHCYTQGTHMVEMSCLARSSRHQV